jgi:transcription elongation factor GreA
MLAQDVVGIGSVVTIRDGNARETWTIVPSGESDPAHGRISEDCAMAVALLGHGVGDRVEVAGRRGWIVEILAVKRADG